MVVEPDIAFTLTGGAGDPTMTAGEGNEDRPVPTALVALTVHV